MKIRATLTVAAMALFLTACQDLAGPAPVDDTEIQAPQAQETGPDNVCRGQIISGIASTWPWARNHASFPPPPGSLALFVELTGLTVQELQALFCG